MTQYLSVKEALDFEGIHVSLVDGNDTYNFDAGFIEIAEDRGGCFSVIEKFSVDSVVYKNGEFFLPWHVGAALGNNGRFDSWVESASFEDVLEVLKSFKRDYKIYGINHLIALLNGYRGNWF